MYLQKTEDGFTITELIVTITVIGIILVGITQLFMTIETTQRRTQLLETATRAGERQIESLRNAHYNSLEPDSTIDFTSDLPDNLHEPRSGIVAVSEPEPGLRRVDVTISYRDGSADRQVRLSSMIGVIGIGQ